MLMEMKGTEFLMENPHWNVSLSGGVTLILQMSFIMDNQQFHIWFCNSKIYFIFFSIFWSIWFIISMTFDRFYNIIQPDKAASFNTIKRA